MANSEKSASLTREDVTGLLQAWSQGDSAAPEKLAPVIYAELRRLARRALRGEHAQQTLETGALINEAYLRLADWKNARWENRAHFYGVAAQIMRRILCSHARARYADKRGGAPTRLELDEALSITAKYTLMPELIALDNALLELARINERQVKVVELRFFGGLSIEETAEALGISVRTVHTDWAFARAWLYRRLTAVHAH